MQNLPEDQTYEVTQNTPPPQKIKNLRSLVIFFFVTMLLTWVVWLWPIEIEWEFQFLFLGFWHHIPISLIKILIGNCLPGVLAMIWALFEGGGQFRTILSTLGRWRTPLRWYFIAFVLPWAVFLVSQTCVLLYWPTPPRRTAPIGFLSTLLLTLPFAPLWEEIAWRAFALPKLESRYSRLASSLILGTYWALWHIPLWLVLNNDIETGVVLAALGKVIAWSVIFARLYHWSSESLPVVIFLHATYDAAWSQITAAVTLPQMEYISCAISVCLALLFGRYLAQRSYSG